MANKKEIQRSGRRRRKKVIDGASQTREVKVCCGRRRRKSSREIDGNIIALPRDFKAGGIMRAALLLLRLLFVMRLIKFSASAPLFCSLSTLLLFYSSAAGLLADWIQDFRGGRYCEFNFVYNFDVLFFWRKDELVFGRKLKRYFR